MIYGSVCSGIEAATVAWHPLGWRPAFFCEIDAFPSSVLSHHYPAVPLHGDFTTIREGHYAAIDVLVGGTPCQSFSVAGLRAGLDDERGNLALEFCRLARRLGPRWVVWENVPGVLSLDGGRAFASILGGLAECGYGLAYRVLDAQFVRVDGFGRAVPQRRRRVFVVGCLGSWQRAAAVLFERASMCGNPPPRREAGERAARTVAASTRGCCGKDDPERGLIVFGGNNTAGAIDAAAALNAKGGAGRMDFETETLVAHSLRGGGFDASEDGSGRGTPLVPEITSVDASGNRGGTTQDAYAGRLLPICFSSKDHGADAMAGIAPTLRAMGHDSSHPNAGGQLAVVFDENQITSADNRCNPKPGDPSHTLTKSGRPPTLAFNWNAQPDQMNFSDETTPTLSCSQGAAALLGCRVRRLMPVECERLQGFPDGYTAIPYRGKPAADGPRYKALGNSMAVNVMRWIGRRIEAVDKITRPSVADPVAVSAAAAPAQTPANTGNSV